MMQMAHPQKECIKYEGSGGLFLSGEARMFMRESFGWKTGSVFRLHEDPARAAKLWNVA